MVRALPGALGGFKVQVPALIETPLPHLVSDNLISHSVSPHLQNEDNSTSVSLRSVQRIKYSDYELSPTMITRDREMSKRDRTQRGKAN